MGVSLPGYQKTLMPSLPITYSELFGARPTEGQLSDLISSFKTEPTFISLAMWNVMLSLFEANTGSYKALQGFFIHNLIRSELKEEVYRLAALSSGSPRPVFGRWQLLAVMKKLLLAAPNEGLGDPRNDEETRRALGDACLMMNDLLFPEEQDERLNAAAGNREGVSDELMAQMLFQFELYHVPDVYQAVARNKEYFDIFERRVTELRFPDGQTLVQKFKTLTGLELPLYLQLYFSIWTLHNRLQETGPYGINDNPNSLNFDTDRVFALMALETDVKDVFFRSAVAPLSSLIEGVSEDAQSDRAWQFDYATFRDHPLVHNSDSMRGFTCVAYPFLTEKLASGVYHTILNSWPEGHRDRRLFQGYWGKVFEEFANDRLSEAYPPSILVNRLHRNPYFQHKQSGAYVEVSDAVVDYGDALVLIEHKGGYLSLNEKYSSDVAKLLDGIESKFGKGIKQLARAVGKLFGETAAMRQAIGYVDSGGNWKESLSSVELRRVRRVYPVLVVQDFAMTIGFMNRRLKVQLEEMFKHISIDSSIRVRPLTLLTIENLEDVLAHLGDLSLPQVLDEYASYENAPLSTFNEVFRAFLKRNGIEQQRNIWSAEKGEAFLNSITERFIPDAENHESSS